MSLSNSLLMMLVTSSILLQISCGSRWNHSSLYLLLRVVKYAQAYKKIDFFQSKKNHFFFCALKSSMKSGLPNLIKEMIIFSLTRLKEIFAPKNSEKNAKKGPFSQLAPPLPFKEIFTL